MIRTTIKVEGIADKLTMFNDAVLTGRCKLSKAIGLKFGGSVLPELQSLATSTILTWKDKVEIDLPGFIDPDVELIQIWDDRLEIKLVMGGKVVVKDE